jgi:hypothetical protein
MGGTGSERSSGGAQLDGASFWITGRYISDPFIGASVLRVADGAS